ncbi:MAG: hypothetical protein RIK87_22620 [Fuerstiella sp.]
MSTGRGRTWRPEKKRTDRESRRLKVAILIGTLIALTAMLLVPMFLREPSLRFVSMVPDAAASDATGLPVLPLTAGHVNQDRLQRIFEKLHEVSDHRVLPPHAAASLDDLKAAVRPDEKLLLYCGLECAVRYDADQEKAVLSLLRGPDERPLDFTDFLNTLKNVQTSQIVLLLDRVGREAGLANGKLSDDVMPLLEAAIADARIPQLVVICSSDNGQRSWEYFADAETSPGDSADKPVDGAARTPAPLFGRFSGTAFGHFAEQAFREGRQGHTASVDSLYRYLSREVSRWVQDHYGAVQNVVLLPRRSRVLDQELLVRVDWPSDEDFEPGQQPTANETTADSEAASPATATATANENGGADMVLAKDTPDQQFSALLTQWTELQQAGVAAAATPGAWRDLTAVLLSAETALLDGEETTFQQMRSAAIERLEKIRYETRLASSAPGSRPFAPWVTPAVEPENKEIVDMFSNALDDLGKAENPERLPAELRRSGQLRDAFIHWLNGELRDLADGIDSRPVEQQQADVARYVWFIRNLAGPTPDNKWPREDWPQEFFGMEEVLAGTDAASHVAVLKPLVTLLELRRRTLLTATGTLPDGRPLRRPVWQQVRSQTEQLLTKLTAVERWLAVGPAGQQLANDLLRKAQAAQTELGNRVLTAQELVSIHDMQRTDLPLLIQYLAQQQEGVPLAEELNSALSMVNAILNGTSDVSALYPDGVLKQPDLTTEISSMFALTRDLTQAPVTEVDRAHQRRLYDYVQRRIARTEQPEERQRLFALPLREPKREQLIRSLTTPGISEQAGENRDTGLWLSFWSIRMLHAISGDDDMALWKQWKDLVQAIQAGDSGRCILIRAKLAGSLRTAWIRQHSTLQNTRDSIFVSQDEAASLVAVDLSTRSAAGTGNHRLYGRISSNLCGLTPSAEPALLAADDAVFFDENSRARIGIQTDQSALYLATAGLELATGNPSLIDNWYRLADPQSINEVLLSAGNGLAAPVTLTLAVTNDQDIVTAAREVIVHPSTATEWRVDFFANGRKLDRRERSVRLPPTTRNPGDGKDTPIPLTVRLTQLRGVAQRVRVQCLDSEGTEFWPAEHVLELQDDTAELPLFAPVADGAAPDPKTPPRVFDVRNGVTFVMTPDLVGARPAKPVEIQFVLAQAAQYVQPPTPVYDPGQSRLSFLLRPDPRVDALRPGVLAAEIHFSQDLEKFVRPGAVRAIENLPAGGQLFVFDFDDRIQREFGQREFEFGISTAGVPHAWRWRLTPNDPELLAGDRPTVRAELSVENLEEVKPVSKQDELLLGKDWALAKLEARMHIHGGRFNGTPEWELQLQVARTDSDQPATEVFPAIRLSSPRQETIQVSPGPQNTWNFSTHTALFTRPSLQIAQYGLSSGRYELIARLKPLETNDQPIEHRTLFVCDSTPPLDSEIRLDVPDRWPVDRPLTGTVSAGNADRESGVAEIRIGTALDKLKKVGRDLKFEISPKPHFPVILPLERAGQTDGTLFVEVVNNVGLSTVLEKTIIFYRDAPDMQNQPAKPGAVLFTWNTATKYDVTLAGAGFRDRKSGEGEVKFENVPPGRYTVSWEIKGSDLGKGSRPVTVESDKTTPVEK